MNIKGEIEMNDEVKKIYGKITEIKENSIVVDPVFGSKLEIFYDNNIDTIMVTEENVNVEYTDGSEPRFIQIIGQVKVEVPSEPVEVEIKIPKGQQRKIRGNIVKSEVSQESEIGSVVIELEKINLNMLYSRISKGIVPKPGTLCTVTILDGKIPRVLEITTNNEEELKGPIYTPIPEEKGLIRWPVACMGCGGINHEELKQRDGFWSKGFIREKLAGGATKGEIAQAFVLGGVAGAAYKAYKEKPQGKRGVELYLQIDMYQCPNCFDKKNRHTTFMSVDVDMSDFTYIFEFNNPKFAEFFNSYNPDKVIAQSMER